MKILDGVYHFFDKVEDHVRATLSTHKFIYTFIGGIGVVLFWRGVWHTADILEQTTTAGSILLSPYWSVLLSIILLLITGLFVSVFIGESIIISGIRKEKKEADKTIDEIEDEKVDIGKVLRLLTDVKKEIEVLEGKVKKHNEQA